ncbi:MAG TPA: FGGY family carbohydrate kinase [Patescibacteria group bacterium]|nr:FGGY family carbohydrate kinase [Patescibacteria group bacterium]
MYIVTIDQGTSSTKTALWDPDGRLVAEASATYDLDRPAALWAEIDAERWWAALVGTVTAVLAKSGVAAREIAAVGLDGIGWTLVPVDSGFRPLAPAMTWLDRRAEAEAAELRASDSADSLVHLAANPLDAAYITPKLAWLRRHRPDVFASARWYLTASGFLTARLTGEATCDLTQAYGFHCFDIRGERWDEVAARALGIPLDRLPPLRSFGEIAGGVSAAAAGRTGLAEGTPVLVGGLDAAVGALGGGVTRPGQTQDQGGQAGGMGMSVRDVIVEPRLIFSHHVLPGQYLLQSGTVGGGALAWFREILGRPEITFDDLSAEAATASPGSGGLVFLPYLAGERTPLWSSTARGVFVGLSYATTRAEMLRSIMEGCAFAVYDNLRVAEATGVRVSEWLGTGGAARSAAWNQIKADVTGRPFVVARRADGGEGGHGLGLFALAAAAAGLAGDVAATVERLLPLRTVFEPDPARHAHYRDLFEVYHAVSRGLLPQFERLATVAAAGRTVS